MIQTSIRWANANSTWVCFSSHSILLYFRLGISLQACLLQIVGYRNLIADVEKLRREPYDSENPQHEEMLLKVSPFPNITWWLPSTQARHSLYIEDTKMSRTWALWQIGQAEFSCQLGVNFSSENSYEKLTLKPVDLQSEKTSEVISVGEGHFTLGSGLDCFKCIESCRRNETAFVSVSWGFYLRL